MVEWAPDVHWKIKIQWRRNLHSIHSLTVFICNRRWISSTSPITTIEMSQGTCNLSKTKSRMNFRRRVKKIVINKMWLQEGKFKMKYHLYNKNKFKDWIKTCMRWLLIDQATILHIGLVSLIISRKSNRITMQKDTSKSYVQSKDKYDGEEKRDSVQILKWVTKII